LPALAGVYGRELGEGYRLFRESDDPKFAWLIAVGRNFNVIEETILTIARVGLPSASYVLLLGVILSRSSHYP
jgi:hypothetical protein